MFDIIINPKGGKGKSLKALKLAEKILREHGAEYTVHNTEYAGHATELARELSSKPDAKIIVMGGDGSFNEVLNGITDFNNVTLGIVACGTGNDFIRASGHPRKVRDAIELILRGNVGYIDYIDVGSRRCLNVAGAGMDVDVLLRYAEMKAFRGKVKYYASLFDTLAHVKWHKLRITIDGRTMDKSVFMIGVGNGTCIGGGMPIQSRLPAVRSVLTFWNTASAIFGILVIFESVSTWLASSLRNSCWVATRPSSPFGYCTE